MWLEIFIRVALCCCDEIEEREKNTDSMVACVWHRSFNVSDNHPQSVQQQLILCLLSYLVFFFIHSFFNADWVILRTHLLFCMVILSSWMKLSGWKWPNLIYAKRKNLTWAWILSLFESFFAYEIKLPLKGDCNSLKLIPKPILKPQ